MTRWLWIGACGLLFGCGPIGSGASSQSNARAAVAASTATTQTDDGTALSATAQLDSVTCSKGNGTAALSGTVSTTGSVDSVEISAQVDGGAAANVGVIEPQAFQHDGRVKTAAYAVNVSLADGTHQVTLCFTQSGAQGRTPKQVCAAPVSVSVACEASSCAGMEPFGDLVGNPSLCRGNGPPHIPVHVKGDFGDAPTLEISGPGEYGESVSMNHAGQSCVYQYNWDTRGNGGAGTYTFSVTGNGQTLRFTADLECR